MSLLVAAKFDVNLCILIGIYLQYLMLEGILHFDAWHFISIFFKQWQELCLSVKTNEVYIQAKIVKRGAKHHERLAHPRNAVEYTLPRVIVVEHGCKAAGSSDFPWQNTDDPS